MYCEQGKREIGGVLWRLESGQNSYYSGGLFSSWDPTGTFANVAAGAGNSIAKACTAFGGTGSPNNVRPKHKATVAALLRRSDGGL